MAQPRVSAPGGTWLPPRTGPAGMQLLCLPYAGGGAGLFRSWPDALGPQVDVVPVQLPGRETRSREAPIGQLDGVVAGLVGELHTRWDRPYALFGHSMGARIAFRATQLLQARGMPAPAHLFLSATSPRSRAGDEAPIESLSDAEFRERVKRMRGTPPELLADEELMAVVLPRLRADFAVVTQFRVPPGVRIGVPITTFAGRDDDLSPPEEVAGWQQHTRAAYAGHVLPGDHYFLHSAEAEVTGLLRSALIG